MEEGCVQRREGSQGEAIITLKDLVNRQRSSSLDKEVLCGTAMTIKECEEHDNIDSPMSNCSMAVLAWYR